MQQNTLIRFAARTDKGKIRYHNEDNFLVGADLSKQEWRVQTDSFTPGPLGSLMVVADGMGGANAGEVASQLATEAVKKYFLQINTPSTSAEEANAHLQTALMLAHRQIVQHAAQKPDCEGMGTTVLLVWVVGNKAFIGWSGDSRCYLYQPLSGLKLLIDDHSLVWEMVMKGELTEDEAAVHDERNIITQSLGAADYPPKPEFRTVELHQGDRLLLCSDGLNSMLLDREISAIFAQSDDISINCTQLIEAANQAGGEDNITVVLFEMVSISYLEPLTPPQSAVSSASQNTKPRSHWLLWIIIAVLLAIGIGLLWWYQQPKQTALSVALPPPMQPDSVVAQPKSSPPPSVDTTKLPVTNVKDSTRPQSPSPKFISKKDDQNAKQVAELGRLKKDIEVYQKNYNKFFAQYQQLQTEINKPAKGLTKINAENTPKQKLQSELKQVEAGMELWQKMINEKQAEIDKIEKKLNSKP